MKKLTKKEYNRIYMLGYQRGINKNLTDNDIKNFLTPTKRVKAIRNDEKQRILNKVLGLIDVEDKGDFWEWCRNKKGFDYCDKDKQPIEFILAYGEYLKKMIKKL